MSDIEVLIDEVRVAFHQLARRTAELHADEPVSVPMRAVLEFLVRNGPTTVPDIARSRSVTRQHIQTQANALLELQLVELRDNPAHRRSSLVALTDEGSRTLDALRARERPILDALASRIGPDQLGAAIDALRGLRAGLKEV